MRNGIAAGCLLLALLGPAVVSAELTKCDGVWTNKPCSGAPAEQMTESKPTPRPQREIDADQKRALVSELDNRRLSVRSQHGVDVGISAERSLCANPETSVTECAHAVNEKEKYFDERALAAANLKAAEKQAGAEAPAEDPGTVTIIQQSGDQYINGRPIYRRTPRSMLNGQPLDPPLGNRPPHVHPRPTALPPVIDPPRPPRPPPPPRKPAVGRMESAF